MDLEEFNEQEKDQTSIKRIQRLEADLRAAKADAKSNLDRALEAERIREGVFQLTEGYAPTPTWALERSGAHDAPHVPVLVTSDFHFGEVIDPANMGGINAFNLDIAEARYKRLIQQTIDISMEHLPRNTYPGIIVLRLGDTVAGDIHEELSKTNDMPTLPTCRRVVQVESWGLERLAAAFGEVYVISVPGNHGRSTKKKESKGLTTQSYDQLISWWLEDRFRLDKRVSFNTPEAGDAVFDVHGRTYLATHGDRIGTGGGRGFLGAVAPITRGMRLCHESQAKLGQPIDKVFMGHFHHAVDVGYGWANGSLPGYSEYARDGRMVPEAPVQWLIMLHPKYGATSQWQVLTHPEPKALDKATPFR
jgi:hypothetical protein